MSSSRGRAGWRRPGRSAFTAAVLFLAAGCASGPFLELQGRERFASEVREILGVDRPSTVFQHERQRLLEMGPELDSILVVVAEDRRARIESRTNALVLLADRQAPEALATLRTALQDLGNERLRSGAVQGLARLAASSEQALELIRLAAEDRSRIVRLTALQSLDIREIETIRRVLERETDPDVRAVAFQLVALAESRGASLVPDRRGALRSAGNDAETQIVFRPVRNDSLAPVVYGDLRIEPPNGPDIPLGTMVEVVDNVVPAFFSPDRRAVVVETDGEIRVADINARSVRTVGPGVAPRPVPFSNQFVFLREKPGGQMSTADGIAITYDVFLADFSSRQPPRQLGSLRAVTRSDVKAGESPIRWMVVGEMENGFVLRGENIEPFPLPAGGVAPTGNSPQ